MARGFLYVYERIYKGETEMQAVNIINGFHIPDYVKIAAIKAEKEAQENEN